MPEFKISSDRQKLIAELIDRLPMYRKKLHLSQTDLAAKIGKSRQTLSDIERGVAPMGWDTYLAILMVFECNGLFRDPEVPDIRSAVTKELTLS